FVDESRLRPDWDRDRILSALNDAGVPCYVGSCPEIYLESAFDGTGLRPAGRLPVAEALGRQSLMFLVHPTLRDDEIEHCCQTLVDVMKVAAEPMAGADALSAGAGGGVPA